MYNTLSLFSNENGKRESSHQNSGRSLKRHGKLRYPVKFPCSLLELYREQGLHLLYVIQQLEG